MYRQGLLTSAEMNLLLQTSYCNLFFPNFHGHLYWHSLEEILNFLCCGVLRKNCMKLISVNYSPTKMCIVWYGHNYVKYQKECGMFVLSTCVTLFIYMWMLKYLSCNWKLLWNLCHFMKNDQEVKATVFQKYRRISVFKMRVRITHLTKEEKYFSNIPFPWQHIVPETISPSIKKKVLY